jgi:hypothetical protein
MLLKLVRALVTPKRNEQKRFAGWTLAGIENRGKVDGVVVPLTVDQEECALTRTYAEAVVAGRLGPNEIGMVQFVNSRGETVTTDHECEEAVLTFFKMFPMLHRFASSQNMSTSGKILLAKRPIDEMLLALYGEAFAGSMDKNKWMKFAQIACQPGRLLGRAGVPESGVKGQPGYQRLIKPISPLGEYVLNVYIDEKRPEEDGTIYVNPEYWAEMIAAYSTPEKPLRPTTSAIKVNSADDQLAIKGVMVRATHGEWQKIIERSGRDDFQMLLCGNAIKHNLGFMVGEVYEFNQTRFAHHSDSQTHRGHRVNVSKQVITRSGMDSQHFINAAAGPALARLGGLMQFKEDHVLAAIGAFAKDGSDNTLENTAALKKRILEQLVPANHPVNALQIYRLAMSVVREGLAKINVPGFHGMGIPSNNQRGLVFVPHSVYKNWTHEHGSAEAYLFRMPYLGSYGGRFVQLLPANTDTLRVNWQDALQMEGDFDGDDYYVIPAHYVRNPRTEAKPERPAKGAKEVVPLSEETLHEAIVEQAANKGSIGVRDTLLSVAYDAYYYARHKGDQVAEATWSENINKLSVYVQQAIEGLKHGSAAMLTDDEAAAMFAGGEAAHPYTQLFTKLATKQNLHSTRLEKGYIDQVKAAVSDEHHWHPLHGIFVEIAKLQFGEILQLREYYPIIKKQRIETISRDKAVINGIYAHLRKLLKMYTDGVDDWAGGSNKKISFGKDVLEPIRLKWAALQESMAPGGEGALRDLHLMLADVAYEPQPNWYVHSTKQRQLGNGRLSKLGLYTRMRKGEIKKNLAQAKIRKIARRAKLKIKRDPKKILVQWMDQHRVGRFTFYQKDKLPRTGSLFHHLADPKFAREILAEALPRISFEDLARELVEAARTA